MLPVAGMVMVTMMPVVRMAIMMVHIARLITPGRILVPSFSESPRPRKIVISQGRLCRSPGDLLPRQKQHFRKHLPYQHHVMQDRKSVV